MKPFTLCNGYTLCREESEIEGSKGGGSERNRTISKTKRNTFSRSTEKGLC